jgi:hypothetical protein
MLTAAKPCGILYEIHLAVRTMAAVNAAPHHGEAFHGGSEFVPHLRRA